jgi:hypothetical protein
MPRVTIAYRAPATVQGPLAVSLVETSTGNVWSPSAKAFVPTTPSPADMLSPLTNVGGPNHPQTYVGVIANGPPVPTEPGDVMVYPHPAEGGPPVDSPFALGATPIHVPPGFGLALILQ